MIHYSDHPPEFPRSGFRTVYYCSGTVFGDHDQQRLYFIWYQISPCFCSKHLHAKIPVLVVGFVAPEIHSTSTAMLLQQSPKWIYHYDMVKMIANVQCLERQQLTFLPNECSGIFQHNKHHDQTEFSKFEQFVINKF